MEDIPYVDIDYCQFSDWGYQKPTRIWGSPVLRKLKPRLCDMRTCPNVVVRANGFLGHQAILGATPRWSTPNLQRETVPHPAGCGTLSHQLGP